MAAAAPRETVYHVWRFEAGDTAHESLSGVDNSSRAVHKAPLSPSDAVIEEIRATPNQQAIARAPASAVPYRDDSTILTGAATQRTSAGVLPSPDRAVHAAGTKTTSTHAHGQLPTDERDAGASGQEDPYFLLQISRQSIDSPAIIEGVASPDTPFETATIQDPETAPSNGQKGSPERVAIRSTGSSLRSRDKAARTRGSTTTMPRKAGSGSSHRARGVVRHGDATSLAIARSHSPPDHQRHQYAPPASTVTSTVSPPSSSHEGPCDGQPLRRVRRRADPLQTQPTGVSSKQAAPRDATRHANPYSKVPAYTSLTMGMPTDLEPAYPAYPSFTPIKTGNTSQCARDSDLGGDTAGETGLPAYMRYTQSIAMKRVDAEPVSQRGILRGGTGRGGGIGSRGEPRRASGSNRTTRRDHHEKTQQSLNEEEGAGADRGGLSLYMTDMMRATEAAHALRRRLPSDAEARVVDGDDLDLAESLPLRLAVAWANEAAPETAPALSATAAAEFALHSSGLRCVPTTAESRAAMIEDGRVPPGMDFMPIDGGTVALRGAGHHPTTVGYSGARRVAKQSNAMPLAGSGRSRSLMYDRWRRGLTGAQPVSSGSRLGVKDLRRVLQAEEEAEAEDIRDLHEKLAVTVSNARIGGLDHSQGGVSGKGTRTLMAGTTEQSEWHTAMMEAAAAQEAEDAARAAVQAAVMAVEDVEAAEASQSHKVTTTAGGPKRAERGSRRGSSSMNGMPAGGEKARTASGRQRSGKGSAFAARSRRGVKRSSKSGGRTRGSPTSSKASQRRESLREVDTRSPETIEKDQRAGRAGGYRGGVKGEAEAAAAILGASSGDREGKSPDSGAGEASAGVRGPERLALMAKVCRISAMIDILKRRKSALEHPEQFSESERVSARRSGVPRSRGSSMEWGDVSSVGTGEMSPAFDTNTLSSPSMQGSAAGAADWSSKHMKHKRLTMMAAMSAASQAAAIAAGAFGEGGTGGFSLQSGGLGGDPQEAASEAAARAADMQDQAGRVESAVAMIDKELTYWRQERDALLKVLPVEERPRVLQGVAALRERGAAQWEAIAAADAMDALSATKLDSRLASSGRMTRSDRGEIRNRAEAAVLSAVCSVAPLSAVSLATSTGSLVQLDAPSSLLDEPAQLIGSIIEARDPTTTVSREDAADRRMHQVTSHSVGSSLEGESRARSSRDAASSGVGLAQEASPGMALPAENMPMSRGLGVVREMDEEEEEDEDESNAQQPAKVKWSGTALSTPDGLPAALDWGRATGDPHG